MSITSLIRDLNNIENEIKKTSQYLTNLKKQRTELEQSIILFLQSHNLPGFKYEGKIYQPQSSRVYRKKKKDEKEEHIKTILEKSGARVNEDIITDVFTVFKSKPIPVQKLKTNVKIN